MPCSPVDGEPVKGAPTSFSALRATLAERMPDLALGQQRIARLILNDPDGTAFRSIGECAQLAEVHPSSLVRFATALGLPGYPALVQLCRDQLASEAQLVRRLEQSRAHPDPQDYLQDVVAHDTSNITRSFARIEPAEWERAVMLLADSAAVHVVGMRKCFSVAYLMSYLLHMVRPRVRHIVATAGLLVDELRDIDPSDVLVAISIRRYTEDTVRSMELARSRGVRTIALTDDASSPLVAVADVVFFVETGSVTVLRSMSAFIAVAQALSTAVAVRLGTVSHGELVRDEQLLDEFGVYRAPTRFVD